MTPTAGELVLIDLKLMATGNASKEVKDLGLAMSWLDNAQRKQIVTQMEANAATEKQNKLLAQQAALKKQRESGPNGSAGPGGSGGGLLGMIPGGAALLTIGGSIAAATATMNLMAKSADVLGNSLTTAHEKNKELAGSIPIIGGVASAWVNLMEVMSGAKQQIRDDTKDHVIAMAKAGIGHQTRMQSESLWNQTAGAMFQRGGFDVITPGSRVRGMPGPGAMNDPRAWAQYERHAEAERGGESAQRELLVAQHQATHDAHRAEIERRNLDNAIRTANVAGAARLAAKGKADEPGKPVRGSGLSGTREGGPFDRTDLGRAIRFGREVLAEPGEAAGADANYQSALMKEAEARANVNNQLRQTIALLEQAKTSEIASIHAAGKVREAEQNKRKAGLADLEVKEQDTRQQYAAYGGLQLGQRRLALRAAEQANQRGFGSLRLYQQQALQGAGFGEYVARGREKEMEKDPGLKRMQDILGYGGNLSGISQQKIALKTDITVHIVQDPKAMTDAMAEALARHNDKMLGAVQIQADQAGLKAVMAAMQALAGRGP